MTWARAAIFFCSDYGRDAMVAAGFSGPIIHAVPPFLIGTFVQVINMPLVRATITIQDPKCELPNTWAALVHIYQTRGVKGLFHGVSAAVMKTVPKYICAVYVKDWMEENLPKGEKSDKSWAMTRSAIKSVSAGIAGAALTNPLDVIRNDMFKTDLSLTEAVKKAYREEGWAFMWRGMGSNVTAVAAPIAMTIFLTDMLMSKFKKET